MILAAWYHGIFATVFSLLALVLMGIILLQRGRGVGLAGAFGGAGGSSAFGAKTGDVLTWATIVFASVYLLVAVVLNYVFVPQKSSLGVSPPPPPPAQSPFQAPAAPGGGAVAPATSGAPVSAAPEAGDAAPASASPRDSAAPGSPADSKSAPEGAPSGPPAEAFPPGGAEHPEPSPG